MKQIFTHNFNNRNYIFCEFLPELKLKREEFEIIESCKTRHIENIDIFIGTLFEVATKRKDSLETYPPFIGYRYYLNDFLIDLPYIEKNSGTWAAKVQRIHLHPLFQKNAKTMQRFTFIHPNCHKTW